MTCQVITKTVNTHSTESIQHWHKKRVLGIEERIAFNSLRCRARSDMLLLGHTTSSLSYTQLLCILKREHIENFSNYCIIPKCPDKNLTIDNAIVVDSLQRRYVLGKWRNERDPKQYQRDLEFILTSPIEYQDKPAQRPSQLHRRRPISNETIDKRALNSFRCRARIDALMFGHTGLKITQQELLDLLTETHIQEFPKFCLVPLTPNKPLTADNTIVISAQQRRFLIERWKKSRDEKQYESDIELIASNPDEHMK